MAGFHSNDVLNEDSEHRKGKRARIVKSIVMFFQLYLVEGSRDQIGSQYSYCYNIEEDPRTYNEAMQYRDVAFWKEAIDDEIGNEHKVCKLVKSLYVLKQAPKHWHQKFDEVVLSSGFLLNQSEKCVYRKFDGSDKGVICEKAVVILGIKIKRQNKGIVNTQSYYIEKILKKFNREVCSPVNTPMDPVEKLMPNTCKHVDQLEYSRVISCLMYAMKSTGPDIAYAVGRLSTFTSNPSRQHWHAITRVFKYLKGIMNYGLSYVRYPLVLEGYSVVSWINHVEDFIFLLVMNGCYYLREVTI
ncbi:zinc finger, CCHC-type containing protein [Tanacetum coccineum]